MAKGKQQILVIDDQDHIRWSVGEELTRAGYDVDMVSSTEEACEKMDAKEYDIILSDLVMPGEVNGLDLGRILSEASTNAVTIAMSSLGEEAAQQSLDAGFRYFISKPFSVDELLKAIKAATQLAN